ncbi:DUF6470 family protein [Desulfosporosinus sp. Sb-LF]|uniref:DUF6470 family protein n=1 Tax=Desulfosporosinus sp. Sb-LF TaxID=2560027 RepID=UPI00107FBD5D|nr:DUF6470 family protein [Desulfosporosinus sp. Sb-LF]TGE32593.1 hypothetical protein E4K68_10450 [Desulfosporosinus sp. Sb-LF]
MLRINISTQSTRLEYTTRNAQSNLKTTRPSLQMETTPATLEISQPRGELTIDMTPCRYSIGLKNNADFARDNAALGKQTAMDAIARIAQEGYQLAHIESNSNAIADIAADSTRSELLGVTWAHIDAPDIHYQANPVQFNPVAGKVNFTVQPGTVQGDYQPGSVDIRVSQYPSIEISVMDVKV